MREFINLIVLRIKLAYSSSYKRLMRKESPSYMSLLYSNRCPRCTNRLYFESWDTYKKGVKGEYAVYECSNPKCSYYERVKEVE